MTASLINVAAYSLQGDILGFRYIAEVIFSPGEFDG